MHIWNEKKYGQQKYYDSLECISFVLYKYNFITAASYYMHDFLTAWQTVPCQLYSASSVTMPPCLTCMYHVMMVQNNKKNYNLTQECSQTQTIMLLLTIWSLSVSRKEHQHSDVWSGCAGPAVLWISDPDILQYYILYSQTKSSNK